MTATHSPLRGAARSVLLLCFIVFAAGVVRGDVSEPPLVTVDVSQSVQPPPASSEPEPRPEHIARFEEINKLSGGPCESPFGTPLGEAHGVVAYSNCNEFFQSSADHRIEIPSDAGMGHSAWLDAAEEDELDAVGRNIARAEQPPGDKGTTMVYTGMQWQCVEYARRFLLIKYGLVFDDVGGASDIWKFTSVHPFGDYDRRIHLARHVNYDADDVPKPGSMVVWPVQVGMPYGHVAVVVGLGNIDFNAALLDEMRSQLLVAGLTLIREVRIAEQNFHSVPWKEGNYARDLILVQDQAGYYGLVDPTPGTRPSAFARRYVIWGWMTVERDIKPLDSYHHVDASSSNMSAPVPHLAAKQGGDAATEESDDALRARIEAEMATQAAKEFEERERRHAELAGTLEISEDDDSL